MNYWFVRNKSRQKVVYMGHLLDKVPYVDLCFDDLKVCLYIAHCNTLLSMPLSVFARLYDAKHYANPNKYLYFSPPICRRYFLLLTANLQAVFELPPTTYYLTTLITGDHAKQEPVYTRWEDAKRAYLKFINNEIIILNKLGPWDKTMFYKTVRLLV